MSSITCHTLGGFKGGFFVKNGRPPTEQEIFNAGMRSGRDIIWPKHMVDNPDNQEMMVIDKKLFEEMLRTFCAFAHPDRVKAARQVKAEHEVKEVGNAGDAIQSVRSVNTTGKISALNTPEHLKKAESNYLKL